MYSFVDAALGPDKEGITIMAEFVPLDLKTMSKFTNKDQVRNTVHIHVFTVSYNYWLVPFSSSCLDHLSNFFQA